MVAKVMSALLVGEAVDATTAAAAALLSMSYVAHARLMPAVSATVAP